MSQEAASFIVDHPPGLLFEIKRVGTAKSKVIYLLVGWDVEGYGWVYSDSFGLERWSNIVIDDYMKVITHG